MPTNRRPSTHRSSVKATRLSRQRSGFLDFIFSLDYRIVIACVLLIILALWLIVDSISFAGKCYAGVKIGGIDVSGLTETQAKEKLQSSYDKNLYDKTVYIFTEEDAFNQVNLEDYFEQQDRVAEQISSLEEANDAHIFQTNATDVGASYNYDSAVKKALKPGHNLNVFTRLGSRLFGTHFNLNLEVGDGLDALYSKVAYATGEPHTDFGIEVKKGEVSVTEGSDGKAVSRDKFSDGLSDALQTQTTEPQKVLFNIENDPIVIDEEKANVAKQKTENIIEVGASFTFNGNEISASKTDLGNWISAHVNAANATLEVGFDENKAKQGISRLINDSSDDSNISVSFSKEETGDVVVNPEGEISVPDLQLAVDKLKENKLGNTRIDDVIEISESEQKGNFTFDEALELGLITEISSYTTTYTNTASTANRNHNIELVSDTISNTIIAKNNGEFSYNNASGPTDSEHGYLEAGTTVGSETVQETGGGICQVATTVFNAAYEGGYPITERHNHALRNLSYPAGRDAAVYVSDSDYEQDLRWKNDTSSDILLRTWHNETSVTVALYGVSPDRRVESIAGNFEEGEKHEIKFTEDDTLSNGQYNIKTVGADGTKINVERKVYDKSGNLLYDNIFASVYGKIDEEISVGPGTDTEKIKKSRTQA